ncbi:MAG: hypothetical protein AAF430_12345 [Myxococcota bacterium]
MTIEITDVRELVAVVDARGRIAWPGRCTDEDILAPLVERAAELIQARSQN